MQDQRRVSVRQTGFVSPYFLPQMNNVSGSSSIHYSARDQSSSSFNSFNASVMQSPRRKVTLVPAPLIVETTPQMPRKSFIAPMTESNGSMLLHPSLLANQNQNFSSLMQLPLNAAHRPSIRVLDPQSLINAQKRSSILLQPTLASSSMLDGQPQNSSAGEMKLLKYFERQTAAMEKLAERVEMQKREEQDRAGGEAKKYGAVTERPRASTFVVDSPLLKKSNYEDSYELNTDRPIRHAQDIRPRKVSEEYPLTLRKGVSEQPLQSQGNNSKYKSQEVIDEEDDEMPVKNLLPIRKSGVKNKTTALQALGELYLMGKLPGIKSEKNDKSNSAIWALVEEQLTVKKGKLKQKASEEELDKEEVEPKFTIKKGKSKQKASEEELDDETESKSPKSGLSKVEHAKRSQAQPRRERKYLQARRAGVPMSDILKSEESSESDSSSNSSESSKEEHHVTDKESISPTAKGKNKSVKTVQFKELVIKPKKSEDLSGGEEENLQTSDRERSGKKQKTLQPKSIIVKRRKSTKPGSQVSLTSIDDKKRKEAKKLKVRQNLRSLLWVVTYPGLFSRHVEKVTINRKEIICKGMNTSIDAHFKNAEAFLIAGAEKHLRDLVCETKSMEMFIPGKTINDKILDVRANWFVTNVKGLFDKLFMRTTVDALSDSFLKFLVLVSEDFGVLPRDFMFDFEIKRLHYNCYGNLKNMTPAKSKMVIGSFILLRVLIHRIIMRPWTVFTDIKKEKFNKKNLLTIGSILYYLIINLYKKSTPICHNNQSFLPNHYKVKAKGIAMKAVDEDAETGGEEELSQPKANGGDKDYDAIKGFLPQESLKSFFCDRRKLADQLRALIEGWHDKIYELTHEVYLQMPKQQMKKLNL